MENFSDITHWKLICQEQGSVFTEKHEFPKGTTADNFIAPAQKMDFKIKGIACPTIALNSAVQTDPITRLKDNTPIIVWFYKDKERIAKFEGVVVQYDISSYFLNMSVHTYEYRRLDINDTEMVYIDFRKNKMLKYIDIDFSKQQEDWGDLPF